MPPAVRPGRPSASTRSSSRAQLGDGRYRLAYDVGRKVCTLHQIGGQRKDAPPARMLPRLPGWRLDWEHKNRTRRLR